MTTPDLVLATAILAGALFLLYRSLWVRRGACPGCEAGCPRPPLRREALVTLRRPGSGRPS